MEHFDDSAVVVHCRIEVGLLQQWAVRREHLRCLKAVFDEPGIEIPFPHLTVSAGDDREGNAPALPLRLVRGGTGAG